MDEDQQRTMIIVGGVIGVLVLLVILYFMFSKGSKYEGYNIIMSADSGGNDITHLENATFSACKQECDNRADCRGFNFSARNYPDGNGTCWIKNNVGGKGPTGDWNLFVKKAPGPLSGNEGETIYFGCPIHDGNIVYGAQGKTINYNIPAGTESIRVTNPNMGGDPIPGVFKQWTANYTC